MGFRDESAHWSGETSGDRGNGAEDRLADRWQTQRDQSHGESQSLSASGCRTSISHRQESIPPSESAVSQTGQERASTLYALWPGQRGHRQPNRHDLKKPQPNLLKQ